MICIVVISRTFRKLQSLDFGLQELQRAMEKHVNRKLRAQSAPWLMIPNLKGRMIVVASHLLATFQANGNKDFLYSYKLMKNYETWTDLYDLKRRRLSAQSNMSISLQYLRNLRASG